MHPSGASLNLLRVADFVCDARCTFVQLRFSTKSAAARDGFPKPHFVDAWACVAASVYCCRCTAVFIAAHNQHYTVLLKSVHGTRQDVRVLTGREPVAWSK
jgi:hypothetical protein